jgi:hypothetical protein
MELRTVRRGVAALATAAILGIAGASPAAAQDFGWLEKGLSWVAGLWAGDGAAAAPEAAHTVAYGVMVEKGAGLDPNGGSTPPPPPPPENPDNP